MKYMLIHYIDEALLNAWDDGQAELSPEDDRDLTAWDEEMDSRGILIGGGRLTLPRASTTLRVRDGEMLITDGPFAETKEHLSGFIIIDARDLNEAIRLAGNIPMARLGTIEVRPVRELERTDLGEAGA